MLKKDKAKSDALSRIGARLTKNITPPEVLLDAADYLKNHSWEEGVWLLLGHDDDDSVETRPDARTWAKFKQKANESTAVGVCLEGAIFAAAPSYPAAKAAICHLENVLAADKQIVAEINNGGKVTVPDFNDQVCQSKAEAIAVLKKAAKKGKK